MSLNLNKLNCFSCNSGNSSPESPKTFKPPSNIFNQIDLEQDKDSFTKESSSSKEESPQITPETLTTFSLTPPPNTHIKDNNKSLPETWNNTDIKNSKHLSLTAFNNNTSLGSDSGVFLTSTNSLSDFSPTHQKSGSTVSTNTFGKPK